MAVEIVMPRLGWTMEEGTLVEWLRKPGEAVQAGEVLLTVETDKAINEVESFDAGRLHIPEDAPAPGPRCPWGTVLGYLLAEGEEPPASVTPAAAGPEAAALIRGGRRERGARGGSRRCSDGGRPARLHDSRHGPDVGGTVLRPAISPRARRLAQQLGIDWRRIPGTGRTGRITEDDVRAAAADQAEAGRSAES